MVWAAGKRWGSTWTETWEVSSADMTRPPNPQNSAEALKPMNNRVPVISQKHSSLFLPLTSHMQACAIRSYAKVCKIVRAKDRSGPSWHGPSQRLSRGSAASRDTWNNVDCQSAWGEGCQGCWEWGLLGLCFRDREMFFLFQTCKPDLVKILSL